MCGDEFYEHVDYWSLSWLPARSVVEDALESRGQTHPSGRILKLSRPCPWQEHLYDLEKELGLSS